MFFRECGEYLRPLWKERASVELLLIVLNLLLLYWTWRFSFSECVFRAWWSQELDDGVNRYFYLIVYYYHQWSCFVMHSKIENIDLLRKSSFVIVHAEWSILGSWTSWLSLNAFFTHVWWKTSYAPQKRSIIVRIRRKTFTSLSRCIIYCSVLLVVPL